MSRVAACPKCDHPLPVAPAGGPQSADCTHCGREVTRRDFPALQRALPQAAAAAAAQPGDAVCFNCPDRLAVAVCESCGAYLCATCRTDWFGRRLCLTCIHAHRELKQSPDFRSRLTLYDNLALMVMLVPLIFIPFYGIFFAMVTAPVSLFLVVRHRRSPRGLVPRGRFRLIAAGVLAVLLLALGLAMAGLIAWGLTEFNSVLSGPTTESRLFPEGVDER